MQECQVSILNKVALPVVISNDIIQDIIHKNDVIYVDLKENPFSNQREDFIPDDVWPKKMNNGEVVYHSYANGDKPDKSTLIGRKRRFLFRLMLSTGNPTWKTADDFIYWLYQFENAKDIEEVKEMICGTWCKICKNKSKKQKDEDVGEDAMTLAAKGYKH